MINFQKVKEGRNKEKREPLLRITKLKQTHDKNNGPFGEIIRHKVMIHCAQMYF